MKNAIKRPVDELESPDPNSTWLNPSIKSLKQLKDWILINLGGGLQTVELNDQQLNVIIGDSIQFYTKYEYHQNEYCLVNLSYYKPGVGIDLTDLKIMSIKEISFPRDNIMGQYGDMFFGPYAFFGQGTGFPFFQNSMGNYVGAWTTFHAISEFFNLSKEIMGNNPDFYYDQYTKILTLMPEPHCTNKNTFILLTANREKPLNYYYGNEWVKRICLAKSKILLGIIRKKFGGINLVGGGQVDTSIGDDGRAELDKLEEDIIRSESKGQYYCLS